MTVVIALLTFFDHVRAAFSFNISADAFRLRFCVI